MHAPKSKGGRGLRVGLVLALLLLLPPACPQPLKQHLIRWPWLPNQPLFVPKEAHHTSRKQAGMARPTAASVSMHHGSWRGLDGRQGLRDCSTVEMMTLLIEAIK
jgi:hypothetical protein